MFVGSTAIFAVWESSVKTKAHKGSHTKLKNMHQRAANPRAYCKA